MSEGTARCSQVWKKLLHKEFIIKQFVQLLTEATNGQVLWPSLLGREGGSLASPRLLQRQHLGLALSCVGLSHGAWATSILHKSAWD